MRVTVTQGIAIELWVLSGETPAARWEGPPSSRTDHRHTGDGGGKRSGQGLSGSASLSGSPPGPHPSPLPLPNAAVSPGLTRGCSCLAQGERGALFVRRVICFME